MSNLDEILSSLEKTWQQEKNHNNLIDNNLQNIDEKNNLDQLKNDHFLLKESRQFFSKDNFNNDNENFVFRKTKSSSEKIELEGRRDFFRLRKIWSVSIIIWISIFISFHGGIALAVGFGHLNYENHQSILLTILAEDFLQILGMGYVIVKFLYPDAKFLYPVNSIIKK
ncbi:hypothetical protein LBMAG18_05190 [Alphaproteobacteria bacterium]|nr:hypothetical protein LBMAG18_05190 [Alphaproteobacteria bacterium]